MRRLAFIAPAALVLSMAVAAAADFQGTGGGSSSFQATGIAGLKIDGKAGAPQVVQKGDKLTVTVPLNGHIKTGIAMRDEHCGEAIRAKQHPNASFEVNVKDLKVPASGKSETAKVSGKFTFNGVPKTIIVNYTAKGKNANEITVDGSGGFNMEDFNIKPPCKFGVCVKKDVTFKVQFTVKR